MDANAQNLMQTYDSYSKQLEGSKTSADMHAILQKEFIQYADSIRSFFSGKNETIHSIYDAIRTNAFPYNKVDISDLDNAFYTYDEYFPGFTEYMKKFADLRDTDEIDKNAISAMIQSIVEKDSEFISGIFEKRLECGIDDAMKNVEYLIDLQNRLDVFLAAAKDISLCISQHNSETYGEEILSAYCMYLGSIRKFTLNAVKEIFCTFDTIIKSMESRTPVHGVSETPVYQIF